MDLTGLKSKYLQSCAPSGGSRRKCVSLPFPALEAACISWPSASSSHFKTNRAASSNLPLTLSLLSPLYKDPCICKKPTQIIVFNLPTQEPYLDLICKVTFAMEGNLQVPDRKRWTSWGLLFCLPW